MAMAERTRIAIEALHNEYECVDFTRADLERVSAVSVDTLIRYGAVRVEMHDILTPVSVAELVQLLNECAGDDCFGCSWEYVEIDGEAFRVERVEMYRVL